MSDEQTSLSPGATLHGTYVLETLLGKGGMGAVWRAAHLRLPRPVAIKVLHEHAYESEEILLRFRREAEITSQLGHPHIVEVFDFNVLDDGRAYLVMELLEGQSLRDRLRTAPPLRIDETLEIIHQTASALSRAHRAGIVHRDLKPENLFLVAHDGARPHAKVLDFGISKMQGAQTVLTQGASIMGTPRYMSPEQAQGDNARVDGRADQFSLGAIAYEMLSGRPAFPGESITQVLLKVLQESPPHLREIAPATPPAVADAVMRSLEKLAEDRFADLDAFRAAIDVPSADGSTPAPYRPPSFAHTDPDAIDDTLRRAAPVTAEPIVEPERPVSPMDELPAPERNWPFVLGALAVLGLGLGAGLWFSLGLTEVVVVSADVGPSDAGVVVLDAATVDLGAEDLGAEADLGVADTGEADLGEDEDQGSRRRVVRPEPLPLRLRGALGALEEGDVGRAQRLAQVSLREDGDDRAYGVMAAVYCAKHDLGSARAMLRRTPARMLPMIRRLCKKAGTELR